MISLSPIQCQSHQTPPTADGSVVDMEVLHRAIQNVTERAIKENAESEISARIHALLPHLFLPRKWIRSEQEWWNNLPKDVQKYFEELQTEYHCEYQLAHKSKSLIKEFSQSKIQVIQSNGRYLAVEGSSLWEVYQKESEVRVDPREISPPTPSRQSIRISGVIKQEEASRLWFLNKARQESQIVGIDNRWYRKIGGTLVDRVDLNIESTPQNVVIIRDVHNARRLLNQRKELLSTQRNQLHKRIQQLSRTYAAITPPYELIAKPLQDALQGNVSEKEQHALPQMQREFLERVKSFIREYAVPDFEKFSDNQKRRLQIQKEKLTDEYVSLFPLSKKEQPKLLQGLSAFTAEEQQKLSQEQQAFLSELEIFKKEQTAHIRATKEAKDWQAALDQQINALKEHKVFVSFSTLQIDCLTVVRILFIEDLNVCLHENWWGAFAEKYEQRRRYSCTREDALGVVKRRWENVRVIRVQPLQFQRYFDSIKGSHISRALVEEAIKKYQHNTVPKIHEVTSGCTGKKACYCCLCIGVWKVLSVIGVCFRNSCICE